MIDPRKAAFVKRLIKCRRQRAAKLGLPNGLLHDPSWDILLEFVHKGYSKGRVVFQKTELRYACELPAATLGRHIAALELAGLLERIKPPGHDYRIRELLKMTPEGWAKMDALITDLMVDTVTNVAAAAFAEVRAA